MTPEHIKVWTNDGKGYELLDSGLGKKLERVGGITIVRSEPRAWWNPILPKVEWDKAQARFEKVSKGSWVYKNSVPHQFEIETFGFKAKIMLGGTSKHIGVFPEQVEEWRWMEELVRKSGRQINALNLFGYTGLATLALARTGAKVTHVDGSKNTIDWAKENQKLSRLENTPIRWIIDDALKFLKREVKRGQRYDAIVMDPPSYGKGPKGEVWKIEENLLPLLTECGKLLSDKPLFIILNMYSTDLSAISLENLLLDVTQGYKGKTEKGELALKHKDSNRLLPMSIFASWRSIDASN
jgi:23S rRNA (cytosine1962-C5)-methyltransferase